MLLHLWTDKPTVNQPAIYHYKIDAVWIIHQLTNQTNQLINKLINQPLKFFHQPETIIHSRSCPTALVDPYPGGPSLIPRSSQPSTPCPLPNLEWHQDLQLQLLFRMGPHLKQTVDN